MGGHKPLAMVSLRGAFEGMGFENVRTVQASGNVLFDATDERAGTGGRPDTELLEARIEGGLEGTFGYRIGVTVRRLADLERLVASDPFGGVAVDPATRRYVTFLSRSAATGAEISPPFDLPLLKVTEHAVLSAITLAPGLGTTELMGWLEKRFGKDVTTRNWNTILKVVPTYR